MAAADAARTGLAGAGKIGDLFDDAFGDQFGDPPGDDRRVICR
jgi:hypothetical protein